MSRRKAIEADPDDLARRLRQVNEGPPLKWLPLQRLRARTLDGGDSQTPTNGLRLLGSDEERDEVLLYLSISRRNPPSLATAFLTTVMYCILALAAAFAVLICIGPTRVAMNSMTEQLPNFNPALLVGLILISVVERRRSAFKVDPVLFVLFALLCSAGFRLVTLGQAPDQILLAKSGKLATSLPDLGSVLAGFGTGAITAQVTFGFSAILFRYVFRSARASVSGRYICWQLLYSLGTLYNPVVRASVESRSRAIQRLLRIASSIENDVPYLISRDAAYEFVDLQEQLRGVSRRFRTLARWIAVPVETTFDDVTLELGSALLSIARGRWGDLRQEPPKTRPVRDKAYQLIARRITATCLPLLLVFAGPFLNVPASELPILRSLAVVWSILSVLRYVDPDYKEPLSVLKDFTLFKGKS